MDTRSRRILTAAVVALIAVASSVAVRTAFARGHVAAPARQSTSERTIQVQGRGETTVAPDQATINVGVQTKAKDAQAAMAENADKMNGVIAALEGQGIAAKNIQTSGLSIYYDSQQDEYVASHEVTAKVLDVSKVGAVLDAAVAAGANQSWGVTFGLQDPSAAEALALKAAVANARKHADAIAAALGVGITGVQSAEEPTYSGGPIIYSSDTRSGAATAAPSAPTPVQPGQLTISAQVRTAYTIG
jgi:uncharacterized protein